MARITPYAVMNILFAATIAFFWPCYSIYVLCDECDGLLSDAGRLVQQMWYPGTVDLNYGARGPGRFNGGKESSEVLRGACVPCPAELIAAVEDGYKTGSKVIGPLQPTGAYTQELDVSRALCVRVGQVGLPEGKEYVLRGPRAMSAKDYVLYQLFGPEYQSVFQDLYGPKVYEGTGTRKPRELVHFVDYFAKGNYNKQLFAAGCPFPFMRGKLTNDGDNSFLVGGYYMLNGRPFLAPKLWDYLTKYDEEENIYHRFISSNGALWTTVPADYKAQYKTSPKMTDQVHVGLGDYARIIVTVFGKPINGDDSAFMELEWWYPEMCPEKSCGKEWWMRTSLQYWTEEHYADYAQRFFAGGGDVTALWSGGFDTVLPNVTINVNALRK